MTTTDAEKKALYDEGYETGKRDGHLAGYIRGSREGRAEGVADGIKRMRDAMLEMSSEIAAKAHQLESDTVFVSADGKTVWRHNPNP